jgi:hypothetical protein
LADVSPEAVNAQDRVRVADQPIDVLPEDSP